MSYLSQLKQTPKVNINDFSYSDEQEMKIIGLECRLVNAELDNLKLSTEIVSAEMNQVSTESDKSSLFKRFSEFLKKLYSQTIEIGKRVAKFISGIFKKLFDGVRQLKRKLTGENKRDAELVTDLTNGLAKLNEDRIKQVTENLTDVTMSLTKTASASSKELLAEMDDLLNTLKTKVKEPAVVEFVEEKAKVTDASATELADLTRSLTLNIGKYLGIMRDINIHTQEVNEDNNHYFLVGHAQLGEVDNDANNIPNEFAKIIKEIANLSFKADTNGDYKLFPSSIPYRFFIKDGIAHISQHNEESIKKALSNVVQGLDPIKMLKVIDAIEGFAKRGEHIVSSLNKLTEGISLNKIIENKNAEVADMDRNGKVLMEVLKAKTMLTNAYGKGITLATKYVATLNKIF